MKVSQKLLEAISQMYRACFGGSRIKGAKMLDDACTRGHAYPREIACTRRGHPANSLVQACPIIGVGIRVSVHTYLSLVPRDVRPSLPLFPRHPPPPPPLLHLARQINEQCQRRRRRYASRIQDTFIKFADESVAFG